MDKVYVVLVHGFDSAYNASTYVDGVYRIKEDAEEREISLGKENKDSDYFNYAEIDECFVR